MKRSQKKLYVQTAYGKHFCIFDPDVKGFIVTAPGLPGVITWGNNLLHAKKMAKEAIELCVECLVKETSLKKERVAATVKN